MRPAKAESSAAVRIDLGPGLRRAHVRPNAPASSRAAKAPKDELIRLALGPDGSVAPGRPRPRARAAAPGSASIARRARRGEQAKGKLKGALQRAFKTNDVDVPADLGERIDAGASPGDARPARHGSALRQPHHRLRPDRDRGPLRQGPPADPRRRCRRGRQRQPRPGMARRRRWSAAGVIFPEGRTILSMALGRENVVHVALTDPAAAARVSPRARALAGFHWPRSRSGRRRTRLEDRLG